MKPTMKKWLTGLLSAALLAGNLPVYALNTYSDTKSANAGKSDAGHSEAGYPCRTI